MCNAQYCLIEMHRGVSTLPAGVLGPHSLKQGTCTLLPGTSDLTDDLTDAGRNSSSSGSTASRTLKARVVPISACCHAGRHVSRGWITVLLQFQQFQSSSE